MAPAALQNAPGETVAVAVGVSVAVGFGEDSELGGGLTDVVGTGAGFNSASPHVATN